jgi:hypothetical protein
MGQYGTIKKVIVNVKHKDSNLGVYISYSHPCEASIAILVIFFLIIL